MKNHPVASFVFVRGVLSAAILGLTFAAPAAVAEEPGETVQNWTAPPYWSGPAASPTGAGRSSLALPATTPLPFVALPPCRLVDTRAPIYPAPLGGGFLPAATPRDYTLVGVCNIPANAKAVSLNAAVTNPAGPGFLTLWPKGGAVPPVATLNFVTGQTIANAAVVPISADGSITIAVGVSGSDVILDTNGYYAPLSAVTSLNTLTGDLSLVAGSNVTITPGVGSLTVATTVAQGPAGPQGPSGLVGPAGSTGATGPVGPAGPTGTTGATGSAGAVGPTGAVGPQGSTGPVGPAGATGSQGPVGPAGVAGSTGAQGPIGPAGVAGPQGATGANGSTGLDGRTVLNGTGVPDPGTGVDGDFYLDPTTSTLYGPKAGGAWPAGVSLVGAQGAAGATGATGAPGATGPQGPIGATGAAGATGAVGPIGPTGATGVAGATGATGAAGATGPQGPIGLTGATGAQGSTGATGSQGATGKGGLMGGNYQSVAINTTRYYAPIGHVNDTVEADVRIPVSAGAVSLLRVYYQPAAHTQTVTLTLMVNGAASALTCQVAANGTTCADTSHSVSVADGDQLSVRAVSSANVSPSGLGFSMLYSAN